MLRYLGNKLSNVYKGINVTNETIFGLFFGQITRTFVESKILNILSLIAM